MRKFSLRFKVLLAAGLCVAIGVGLFRLSDEGRFGGDGMVKRENSSTNEIYDIAEWKYAPERSWKDSLPDFLRNLLVSDPMIGTFSTMNAYLGRCFLSEEACLELKSILSNQQFPGETKSDPFSWDHTGCFVFSRGHQWYLLFLADPVGFSPGGKHALHLFKAEQRPDGRFQYDSSRESLLISPELYRQLKEFLNRYDPSRNRYINKEDDGNNEELMNPVYQCYQAVDNGPAFINACCQPRRNMPSFTVTWV